MVGVYFIYSFIFPKYNFYLFVNVNLIEFGSDHSDTLINSEPTTVYKQNNTPGIHLVQTCLCILTCDIILYECNCSWSHLGNHILCTSGYRSLLMCKHGRNTIVLSHPKNKKSASDCVKRSRNSKYLNYILQYLVL